MSKPAVLSVLCLCALAIGAAAAVARPAVPRAAAKHEVRRAELPAWPALATAAGFLRTEIHEKAIGRWGVAWQNLYPAHRRVADRLDYVRCESATPFAAPLKSLQVVRVRRALVQIAGSTRSVPGVALTTRVALNWYGPRDPIVFTQTFHLVPVDGHWTWLLSPQRYALYVDGGCRFHPAA